MTPLNTLKSMLKWLKHWRAKSMPKFAFCTTLNRKRCLCSIFARLRLRASSQSMSTVSNKPRSTRAKLMWFRQSNFNWWTHWSTRKTCFKRRRKQWTGTSYRKILFIMAYFWGFRAISIGSSLKRKRLRSIWTDPSLSFRNLTSNIWSAQFIRRREIFTARCRRLTWLKMHMNSVSDSESKFWANPLCSPPRKYTLGLLKTLWKREATTRN